jgi:hypothetical protein
MTRCRSARSAKRRKVCRLAMSAMASVMQPKVTRTDWVRGRSKVASMAAATMDESTRMGTPRHRLAPVSFLPAV